MYDTGRKIEVASLSTVPSTHHKAMMFQTGEDSTNKPAKGPLLALDLGQKRVGLAVSDELLISTRRLPALQRSSWKQLLSDVNSLVRQLDAKALVIGLPLRLDGTRGDAAGAAEDIARKFALSLTVPVHLQDERLTSEEAKERLLAEGVSSSRLKDFIDSEAAAVILRDYISGLSLG